MLRTTLLAVARSGAVRAAVESGPFDPLVARFAAEG
jgi:proline dehydrogenase